MWSLDIYCCFFCGNSYRKLDDAIVVNCPCDAEIFSHMQLYRTSLPGNPHHAFRLLAFGSEYLIFRSGNNFSWAEGKLTYECPPKNSHFHSALEAWEHV